MISAITAARALTPAGVAANATLLVGDAGRILAVGTSLDLPEGATIVAARGLTLVPGFIDLHVHGGGGYSLATSDRAEIASYARWVVRTGVTSFLAGIYGRDLEEALGFARAASGQVGPITGGASLLGLNLEGPFVNPGRRGALPEGWVSSPNPASLNRLLEASGGQARIITLAPELPGAHQILETALAHGVIVSVGHSDARYQDCLGAFAAGASHLTHAFNAMRPFHHREPGPLGAAIRSGGVTVEVIADGVHLHPVTVELLLRSLGPSRVAIVTDAVPPAGLVAGEFHLGREAVHLREGTISLPNGTLAGSASTMEAAVRNVVLEWQLSDLAGAITMASTVPAGVLELSAAKGRLAPGCDADIVALDADLNVAMTWVGGALVYDRSSAAHSLPP